LTADEPGPASYDPKTINDEKGSYAIFKSSTIRKGITEPNTNPSPVAYNLVNYDIATKIIKEE
jgi:hypothetical protein